MQRGLTDVVPCEETFISAHGNALYNVFGDVVVVLQPLIRDKLLSASSTVGDVPALGRRRERGEKTDRGIVRL
jgi:hypothetical protein